MKKGDKKGKYGKSKDNNDLEENIPNIKKPDFAQIKSP